MTAYSFGRVRICWRKASAITSLITTPCGSRHHGPPSISTAPNSSHGELVAPVAEAALGELHDVALVHQRHARLLLGDGVLDGGADQPLGALLRDRLDADGAGGRKADGLGAHLALEELDDAAAPRRSRPCTRSRRRCPPCSRGRSPCSRPAAPSPARARPRTSAPAARRRTGRASAASATLSERNPPPTGVVSGPLIATRLRSMAASVSSGSQLFSRSFAFSPASTSIHAIRRRAAVRPLDRGVEDAPARPARCRDRCRRPR